MRWWKSTAQWLGTGILGFAGLLLAGCEGADGIAPVSGVVTLNGAPLPDALVRFQPQPTGSPSSAITDSSGRFTLKYTRDANGAQVGEHLVAISTYSPGDPDAEPPRPPVPKPGSDD